MKRKLSESSVGCSGRPPVPVENRRSAKEREKESRQKHEQEQLQEEEQAPGLTSRKLRSPGNSPNAHVSVFLSGRRAQPDAVASALAQVKPLGVLDEVLQLISRQLDSSSLAVLSVCSKSQRRWLQDYCCRHFELGAVEQLMQIGGKEYAERWRNLTWLQRLRLEETFSEFDEEACLKQGFLFTPDLQAGVVGVKLEGIGPKLLLSRESTFDKPMLRWRMELRGNNAVEFGVVPASMTEHPKVLHKCQSGPHGERPAGFCSAITVGSMLPVKLPLMRGSVIEIVATRHLLEYIISNPADGLEITWQNSVTMPKLYRGPPEFRFEQDLSPDQPMKLAVTCWARAALDVRYVPICSDCSQSVAALGRLRM